MRLAAPGLSERARGADEPASPALAHQALLGARDHLPDRRAGLAAHLLGQEHLSLLQQSDRRPAPGVDHRPRRDRHDHRHPARRHRFVGRLGHGLLDDHLRHAADSARMDASRRSWLCLRRRSPRGSAVGFLARFVFHGLARGRDVDAGRRREIVLGPGAAIAFPRCSASSVGALVAVATASQVSTKFGVLAVLLVTPCFALALGAINGTLIVAGRLQPFIATLAMMVSALGLGRLTGGPGQRGHRRLHRNERHAGFRRLALDGLGHPADAEHLLSRRDPHIRRCSALHDLRPLRLRDRRQRRRRRSCPASRSRRSSSPPMSSRACWPGSPAFCSWPSTGRASRTPAPASNSTRSPPS